jgi:tetratricopeptide (TPR) repeat protein
MRDPDLEAWKAADAAFDRLLDLPVAARAGALAAAGLPAAVHQRVERLLAADGTPDTAVDRHGTLAGRRIGRWVVGPELGRGGMSVVHRAHDAAAPEQVAALKIITLGALAGPGAERFRREQSILARLRHPHIATLLEAGVEPDGTPWLAMSLVEGERIDAWCDARGLDARARVRLLLDVCEAVAYAHRALVVHRDLKPSNVLVDADGHVRLLDFGIARLVDDTSHEATATHWRALSPAYAAPEQFTGAPPSTAMDVHGLGALAHAVLTGHPPRDGAAPGATAPLPSRVARDGAALRGDLDAILLKALAPLPEDRYASAQSLADDLQRWLEGRPVLARARALGYRLGRAVRRHWLPVSLATFAAASLAGGTLLALDRAREAEAQAAAAAAARERTAEALDRANALRDFLLRVFQAQAPGRPRNELPSTAELLAEGEALALGADTLAPGVRADMLDAITQVWLVREQPERAQRLVDATLELARAQPDGAPVLAARALLRQAGAYLRLRQHDATLAALERAASLLPAADDSALAMEIALERGNLLIDQRRFDDAAAHLQPLVDAAAARTDLPEGLRERTFTSQAITLGMLGRHRESQLLRERSLGITRSLYGARHLRVAVALANLASGDRALGDFARAIERLEAAIAIYDAVLEGPSPYRGAAWLGLGLVAQAQGRFDDALAQIERGQAETATARGIADPRDYDFWHWNRGIVLAQAGRHAEAAVALQRALVLFDRRPPDFAAPRDTAAAWLAIGACASGDPEGAARWLARIDPQPRDAPPAMPEEAAVQVEARAQCALAAGDARRAGTLLAPQLEADASLTPGFAAEAARRLALAAVIATAQGDVPTARSLRSAALARLREAGLAGHPLAAALGAR